MRTVIHIGVLLAVILSVGCSRTSENAFKNEYRMQVTVGPQMYWGVGATKFAELVSEKTDGRIKVKPYFGSQLLKGAQLNSGQMVAMGAIDLAFESTINTAPVIPELNIFSLPFFVNTYEHVDAIEHGETGVLLFGAMEKKGLKPLAWGENGFRQLTNSKHPVKTHADLSGLKIRVVGTPIFTDVFRVLGADPINMNWGDAVTAFQQGTVDGQENPVAILTAVQIYQYQDYMTSWNYAIDPLIFYWNKKQWDAFPLDIQRAIREAAEEAGRFEKALVRAGLDDGVSLKVLKEEFGYDIAIPDPLSWLKEHGMDISDITPDDRKAFRLAVDPIYETWIDRIGHPVYNAALKDMKQ